MHEVLVNRLGGLSLPRKSVVRLTDHRDMTLKLFTMDVKQQHKNNNKHLVLASIGLINTIALRQKLYIILAFLSAKGLTYIGHFGKHVCLIAESYSL